MNIEQSLEVKFDWETNMVNSIAGQILNNVEAKQKYVRILARTLLSIEDRLKYENMWNDPQRYRGDI